MKNSFTIDRRERRFASKVLPLMAVVLCAWGALLPLQATAGAALERIKQSGTLKIGYGAHGPYVAQGEGGAPGGFAMDLCKGIIDGVKTELGLPTLKVDFIALPRDHAVDAVADGKVDVACEALVPTVASRKRVSYSIPVFASGVGAVVRKDASERLKAILTERKAPAAPTWRGNADRLVRDGAVAVVGQSRTEAVVTKELGRLQMAPKIVQVPDYATGLERVLDGRSSVFFGERSVMLQAIRLGKLPRELQVLDRYFTNESVAFAVPRGDEDLRLIVDSALSRLLRSDAFVDVYTRWFGPLGPHTLTLFRVNTLPE